ncbi:class I SAM-dependent methyltransferase [Gloeocapsopsis dulcis]|uniref:Methyltransferase n=1 Tax=Gloeocapsopsis dulcis AAB1 = 1H9 TaxID=1433147 RepID=A0A6N8FQW6_9CHRO|nr:class I SAM-dependent methyltransferase [Gloeocapsopsis dulcis]MUL35553.1 hypothetical protein [Gloeocapsopsis dulcis AAB1 = 1H9]WNN87544.1 class I SAM-dependent methyltransferase [Gloeocapsopsis dulcis]
MISLELQQQAADYLAQQKYSEAVTLYEQSIEADPTVISNYWYLGLALLLQGQELEAQLTWLSVMTEARQEQVDEWKLELANILSSEALQRELSCDLSMAWAIRQHIHQFAPNDLNNLLSIILISIELELFQPHGKLVLLQATQLILAEEYHDKADIALLSQVIHKLLEINPYDDFIEICLQNEQLIKDSQVRFEIQRKLGLAYNNLGKVLYNQGSYSQAFANFQKVVEITPSISKNELAELKFNMGIALTMQEKFEQAVIYFEEALELEPNFYEAYYQLVKARYEVGNLAKRYRFTQDWFSRNIAVWEQHLFKFANVPDLNMLEIGSWEGRSTCWLIENVLTHETASITCIDTFEGSVEHKLWFDNSYITSIEERFDFNINKTGCPEKVKKIVGNSKEVLKTLPLNYYDLLYIDGSHLACDVLEDAVMSWGLVKVGGTIVFDDYDFTFADNPAQNTKVAIDSFITVFSHKLKIIHQGYQVIIEKIAA